ncbi:histidine kinase A [Tieghemostelium lacteum]|uniref:Histidine kinase A n=1 Tax=Tieghemostelium lacteum TaxID=361077 RepID=A0A152A8W6_TIELA|nr:histidine kinase A [Tieghemostelium lacteum]|eukprot:KYR02660.1 histidine kinase A [Tieghemostelium lacteum]
MKNLVIIPTIPTVNLSNLNRSPSTSNPCSPSTNKNWQSTPYEYDGCMLCVNGTPSCLQKRRATWTLKLRVALYCLSVLHPDKKYFNLKKDIYTYVDSHWDFLSINTAKSDRWRKQVQDSLSHCRHFESGWDAMGCNGHWRLINPLNPWSLPPDKESQIYEDEDSIGSMTPDAGLSPRTTKSPREDPLYRNFPKRRTGQDEQHDSTAPITPSSESRKRKASDEDRFNSEEELLLLKYSPMIFSDTPSPKCRTPRSNQPSSTSPSIIGNSPLLTSSGTHFSLANFHNNLTLNSPSSHSSNNSNYQQQTNLTILESSVSTNASSSSPPSSPSMRSNNSPPIPMNPFAQNWKPQTTTTTTTCSGSSKSPLLFSHEDALKSTAPLPNPFAFDRSKFQSVLNNNNLKVPSELLLKSTTYNRETITLNPGNLTPTSASRDNSISSILTSQSSSSVVSNNTPSTQPALTKLQQQNLILNCTY